MVQTLIMTALSVLVTLTITFLFNGIINLPKKKKAEQQAADAKQELFENKITNKLDKIQKDVVLCKRADQVLLKNDLKVRYDYWLEEGYAPADARDDLEKMYQVYHSLGKNGVMDDRRARFLALPYDPPHQMGFTEEE